MSYKFENQSYFYKGKVRDVYTLGDERLICVTSDRISAFDHILPREIPYKGQVLNKIAAFFLENTKDIVPNWLESVPLNHVSIGQNCTPFKVEMVVRGYLAGHAAREYKAGKRKVCGVALPEGLQEADQLPQPIITPTTKADQGHDLDISREDIIAQNIVAEKEYQVLENYALKLFAFGSIYAKTRGLILVDTKFEFGKNNKGEIMLIDECFTPDSSRYYFLEGYAERQEKGEKQKQLSKEFVREWLMANNFQGKEGQVMPEMPDAFIKEVSDKYLELYGLLIGEELEVENYAKSTVYNQIIKQLDKT